MTQKEIQDMLDNMASDLGSHLSDEELEQRYFARQAKDVNKTRAHYKMLGDACVRSGRHKEVSAKGGRTVSYYKREVILNNNKKKRNLTDDEVIQMKDMYRNDISLGFPELARIYNVSIGVVHNIMNNITYQNIGGDVVIRTPLQKCEHCGCESNKSNYKRWHGDKCKNKNLDNQK